MEPRLKGILEELTELKPVREELICIDIKLDKEHDVIGLSIKTTEVEDEPEEIIWIEQIDNGELDVRVHPDIDDKGISQEFWTVLYCISSNLKKEEEEVWGDLETTEIAEEIYNSREERADVTAELLKYMDIDEVPLEEIPEDEVPEQVELVLNLEELTDLISEYGDDEAQLLVEFVNNLAAMSGLDLQMGLTVIDSETGEEVDPNNFLKTREGYFEGIGERQKYGLMEQDYVIKNASAMVNNLLAKNSKDKDALVFLNQLIYERIQIEKLLGTIFPGED